MLNTLIGQKNSQSQRFLEDGTRIPITEVNVPDNAIVMVKSNNKDGYSSVQLGIGSRKNANKAILGHIREAKLEKAPRFFREVKINEVKEGAQDLKVGESIKVSDVFKPGDIVDVIGISKGKGFAGVVKRHHFKGGPRTHGQSDRERAPGSIGQTTTPGRVYKGKRMAGRMGHKRVTVKNLEVVDVLDYKLLIKGLVPGIRNELLVIRKMGERKKFTPLFKEEESK